MRTITVRYAGVCSRCAAPLAIGATAVYERRVGIYCPPCAPTDTEEIRAARQAAGERRAEKYEGWAEKREERAGTVLNSHSDIRHDIAFNTQPGHIPFRARMIAADDRAYQSLNVAKGFREKAHSLRKVRVAGDAERKRQELREFVRARLTVGQTVETAFYGSGVVEKINRKTALIGSTGSSKTFRVNVDLSFICVPSAATPNQPMEG